MASNSPTRPRPVLADVTVMYGMMSFRVDVLPAARSADSKAKADGGAAVTLKTVCPTCNEPHLVATRYICTHDAKHGPFEPKKCDKAVEHADGSLTRTTEEQQTQAAVATTTVSDKTMDLQLVPTEAVAQVTFPVGNVYQLAPCKKASMADIQGYSLFHELAAEPSATFLTELKLKGNARLYRLGRRGDTLVIVELARPDLVVDTVEVELIEIEDKHRTMAKALMTNTLSEFDPEAWTDNSLARAQVLAELTTGEAPAELPPAKADKADDLFALLEASVAAA